MFCLNVYHSRFCVRGHLQLKIVRLASYYNSDVRGVGGLSCDVKIAFARASSVTTYACCDRLHCLAKRYLTRSILLHVQVLHAH